jgi:hypothetical protein
MMAKKMKQWKRIAWGSMGILGGDVLGDVLRDVLGDVVENSHLIPLSYQAWLLKKFQPNNWLRPFITKKPIPFTGIGFSWASLPCGPLCPFGYVNLGHGQSIRAAFNPSIQPPLPN